MRAAPGCTAIGPRVSHAGPDGTWRAAGQDRSPETLGHGRTDAYMVHGLGGASIGQPESSPIGQVAHSAGRRAAQLPHGEALGADAPCRRTWRCPRGWRRYQVAGPVRRARPMSDPPAANLSVTRRTASATPGGTRSRSAGRSHRDALRRRMGYVPRNGQNCAKHIRARTTV